MKKNAKTEEAKSSSDSVFGEPNELPPYNRKAHVLELEAAGITTRLFTARNEDEFKNLLSDEVSRMKTNPLSEGGRSLLASWLKLALGLSYKTLESWVASYRGGMATVWKPRHSAMVLNALRDVLTFHVKHDFSMCKAVDALLSDLHIRDVSSSDLQWWQEKLLGLQKEQGPEGCLVRRGMAIPHGKETADFIERLVRQPSKKSSAAQKAARKKGGHAKACIDEDDTQAILNMAKSCKMSNGRRALAKHLLGRPNFEYTRKDGSPITLRNLEDLLVRHGF